ncbi:hypothetical protein HY440_03485 [Candidatus Microgenomates bacterium]|nr:hypothetical protein [Candidatus Microgenomates bacterium]
MQSYFSTFISGFGEVVVEAVQTTLPDFELGELFDGLVTYKTTAGSDQIKKLRFLNNSFVVVDKNVDLSNLGRKFRVVFSRENKLVAVEKKVLVEKENEIARRFGLVVDRANPDVEFWYLTRRDGKEFFGARLTKHPDYKDILKPGQLRPELANLLCLLSEPKASDVFLDPFAGSGAIASERAAFPAKKIISTDIAQAVDAWHLKLADSSVDKIVTDPPWGVEVGRGLDIEKFYQEMLAEFCRVVRPGGLVVFLIGQRDLFDSLVIKFSDKLQLERRLDILVSGKKAGVFKLVLKSADGKSG